jgi:hypothetical protein
MKSRQSTARWSARPWRSCDESRIIRRYAFQWYTARGKRPSGRDWARQLGSHTCLQKLVREFIADPSKMWRYRQREPIPDLQNSVRLMKDIESCACRTWQEWQSSSNVNRSGLLVLPIPSFRWRAHHRQIAKGTCIDAAVDSSCVGQSHRLVTHIKDWNGAAD